MSLARLLQASRQYSQALRVRPRRSPWSVIREPPGPPLCYYRQDWDGRGLWQPLAQRWFSGTKSPKPPIEVDDEEEDDDDDRLPFVSVFDHEARDDDTTDRPSPGPVREMRVSPLWELNAYYDEHHGIKASEHVRTHKLVRQNHPDPWTADFVCPVDGTIYPSGTLWSSQATVEIIDGRCYYPKKTPAVHAAAARALDVMQFRTLGVREPRLCREDPSTLDSVVVPEGEVLAEETKEESVDAQATVNDLTARIRETILEAPISEDDESDQPSVDLEYDQDDDDDDEDGYVVHYISTAPGQAPAQRILASLAASGISARQSIHPLDDATLALPAIVNERLPTPMTAIQRLRLAVDAAFQWARANSRRTKRSRNPHRTFVSPISQGPATSEKLLVAKTLLSGLVEANQNIVVLVTANDWAVEKAAKFVLDILWQTPGVGPDTECLNLFLKCLDGQNPRVIAERAEAIVNAMKTGEEWEGHVLPKPNVDTINTLIQVWAQVGGTTGRYDKLDDDFQPTRESFLAILSSAIYRPVVPDEPRGLDVDFAKHCIQRMRELADANPDDESLRPDTQVYNAPLRWMGGSLFRKSRPYARALWENYAMFFGKGLRDFDETEQHVIDARLTEEWMADMISSGDPLIAPDLETYEAVIQAWVRTATDRGMKRAQQLCTELIEKASDDRLCPRMQTFRPVVAGWLLSKSAESAAQVEDLVGRLEGAAKVHPDLRPDGRLLQSIITSQLSNQEGLLSDLDPGDSEIGDEIVAKADRCTQVLEKLCEELEEQLSSGQMPDVFVESTPFEETVVAWKNAAMATLLTNPQSLSYSVQQMNRTVGRLDECIAAVKRIDSPDSMGLRDEQELSLQLKHLLVNAHRVYSAFVIGITDIVGKHRSQGTGEPCLLTDHVLVIERMLRRSAEFEAVAARDSQVKLERKNGKAYLLDGELPHGCRYVSRGRLVYEDWIAVDTTPKCARGLGWTRHSFLRHVVRYLKQLDLNKASTGDVVRVCRVVKDTIEDAQSSTVSDKIDEMLDMVLPVSQRNQRAGKRRVSTDGRSREWDGSERRQGSRRRSRIVRGRQAARPKHGRKLIASRK